MEHTIYCVDDSSMHLSKIKSAVAEACSLRNISSYRLIECSDGKELLDSVKNHRPSLITMDIHMPVMDGLSTLVRLRSLFPTCPMVMVSSENEDVVMRHALNKSNLHHHYDAPEEKKREMLEKVAKRVKAGVQEEGKINSILEACACLGMDPIAVAKHYGANAFISKPFDVSDASKKISDLLRA